MSQKQHALSIRYACGDTVAELLAARVKAEVLREQCDEIQRKLLDAGDYRVSEKWRQYELPDLPERITGEELKSAYLMDDDDSARYHARLDAAYAAAGFVLEPGHCPALIAEHAAIRLERRLIDEAGPLLGLDDPHGQLTKLEHRREFIELIIGLCLAVDRDILKVA